MQLSAIKADTWYAEQSRYGWPNAVIMFGRNRFTAERHYVEGKGYVVRLRETPDAKLGGKRSHTSLLGITLSSGSNDMRQWVEEGEREDVKPELMATAERLIKEVGERAVQDGGIDLDEARKIVTDACEPNAHDTHPLRLVFIQPRTLAGGFAEDHLRRVETDRADKENRKRIEAQRQRDEQYRTETMALAGKLGLDKGIWISGDTTARVPMHHLRAMLEEIDSLRALLTTGLRATEVGEGEATT